MKIVVAVTAASGALYARLCLEQLLRAEEVSEIALVYSAHAREVADFEGVTLPEDPRIRIFDNDDLFAPPASGSADYDAMAVVPSECSKRVWCADGYVVSARPSWRMSRRR